MNRSGVTGFTMIRAAQRQHERAVLAKIRDAVRAGRVWAPGVGPDALTQAEWHAVERLRARGRIRVMRRRRAASGYVLAA